MNAIPQSSLKRKKRALPLGPFARRMFGPYEHWVAETYRKMFIDLDDFAGLMKSWAPNAQRILEVGCGEGAMTERITHMYPSAHVTAIDITPKLGRLYRGPSCNSHSKWHLRPRHDTQNPNRTPMEK
jgi:SAM-dependent methyltransferase